MTSSGALRPVQGHQGAQNCVRADLNDGVHSQLCQGLDAAAEGHRLPGVLPPVGAVHSRFHRLAGQIADERDVGVGDRQCRNGRFHLVKAGFDESAVIGRAGSEPPYVQTCRLQMVGEGMYGFLRPADHLMGTVVHTNAKVCAGVGVVPFVHCQGNFGCQEQILRPWPRHWEGLPLSGPWRRRSVGRPPGSERLQHEAAAISPKL